MSTATRRIRCLMCSHSFTLGEAPVAPVSTPASPEAQLQNVLTDGPCSQLPFGFNRVCPMCRYPLTYAQATGQLEVRPIAIAGGSGVSKSHYLPVLIAGLKALRDMWHRFDILAQETREPGASHSVISDSILATRYGQIWHDRDYGMTIAKTARAASAPDSRIPLIYRLRFPNWWRYLTGRPERIELALRDCAGEEFLSADEMQNLHRYMTHSAAIILLVDPLTVPGISSRIPLNGRNRSDARPFELEQVVASFISMFERSENATVGTKINIPVAVCLAKADLLRDMDGVHSRIFSTPEHLHIGGFNREAHCRQQDRLRAFLAETELGSQIQSLESRFSRVGVFALSALGHDPIPSSDGGLLRVGHVQPWNVLDPLLWSLHPEFVRTGKAVLPCTN